MRIKQYHEPEGSKKVQLHFLAGTQPLFIALHVDKNNIIDFRPLQELNAPQLVCLWTAPQMSLHLHAATAS